MAKTATKDVVETQETVAEADGTVKTEVQGDELPETEQSEDDATATNERTHIVILNAPLGDAELGAFKSGDEYPCTAGTATRLIARKRAKAK